MIPKAINWTFANFVSSEKNLSQMAICEHVWKSSEEYNSKGTESYNLFITMA